MSFLRRFRIDPYLLLLVGVLVLASLLPARGVADAVLGWITDAAIALLFFLQGVRLSREAVINGLAAGRLHLLVVVSTYLLFPALALALNATGLLPPSLRPGLLFLACLPSTIQSSIALVSIGRGNVAAAVCAASLSSLLAVVLTPLLVGLLIHSQGGGFSWVTLKAIVVQLLLPFAVGQLARPLLGAFVERHRRILGYVDRGSILLVVYSAFGHAVVNGVWREIAPLDLARMILAAVILLAVVLGALYLAARALKLAPDQEIVAIICGCQKSLATGAPMAGLLFPAAMAGTVLLPLLVFHQVQLFVTSVLAQRHGERHGQ